MFLSFVLSRLLHTLSPTTRMMCVCRILIKITYLLTYLLTYFCRARRGDNDVVGRRDDTRLSGQCSTAKRNSPELESLEPDVDQQTPQSADALLCRTSPQLTRLASSDQDDDLDFDATAADHDDNGTARCRPHSFSIIVTFLHLVKTFQTLT